MELRNKIFSIKSYRANNFLTHKVITFLGIKLKFRRINKKDIELICQNSSAIKNIYYLFLINVLSNSSEDELYCLRNRYLCYILHKNCLKTDLKFLIDFLSNNFSSAILNFTKLNKNSDLYKEHIIRVQNNEFLWKYSDKIFIISHTYVSKDAETNNTYMNLSYIKEKEYINNNSKLKNPMINTKRKIIEGITLKEYFDSLPYEEKVKEADKVLNWLFTQCKSETDPKKVSGKFFDCHLFNIILGSDSQLHFIDYDLICNENIERGFCIYKMFFFYNKKLYYEMLRRYKCKDKHNFYIKYYEIPVIEPELFSMEHKSLLKKYFTDNETAQNFNINYEKQEILI